MNRVDEEMKSKIIIGCFIIIVVLMFTPSVPAIQFRTVVDSQEITLIDFEMLEQKLNSISNPILKEKIKNIDFDILKQKLNDIQESGNIDLLNIYLLILNILTTILIGRPSVGRLFFTIVTVQGLFYEFRTGELVPRCPKTYAAVFAMPILTLGALLYRLSSNKTVGSMFVLLSSILYYIILIILSSYFETAMT